VKVDRPLFLSFVGLLASCKEPPPRMVMAPLEAANAKDAGGDQDAGPSDESAIPKRANCRTGEPAKACSLLKCPSSPAGENHVDSECDRLRGTLTASAFNRFLDCAMAKSSKRSRCGPTSVGTAPGQCLADWDERDCIDGSTKTACEKVVARCASNSAGEGTLTLAQCQASLSAVQARAQPQMIACMVEHCADATIHDVCLSR
jgi:hypothetical protein